MTGLLTAHRSGAQNARQQRRWTSPIHEMEDIYERLWSDQSDGFGFQLFAPPLDMSETENEVRLTMDLPGIDAKDIDVQLNGTQLTVSAERKEEKDENDQTFHRLERRVGRFARTVLLPCKVQEDKVQACYQDGVLKLTLPKSNEATARRITVQTK